MLGIRTLPVSLTCKLWHLTLYHKLVGAKFFTILSLRSMQPGATPTECCLTGELEVFSTYEDHCCFYLFFLESLLAHTTQYPLIIFFLISDSSEIASLPVIFPFQVDISYMTLDLTP